MPLRIVHVTRDEVERIHPRVSTAARPGALGDLGGLRILAVDDEPDALSLLEELLGAAGARVTTAKSAAEALRELDTDADGTNDYLDTDDDGDGITDTEELDEDEVDG